MFDSVQITHEFKRRLALQGEYGGTNKAVNRIEPLVSIIVTAYQHEPFIRQCLDGILNQKTEFAFEIIIGEDHSTDGTREICIEYADRFPDRVRLFLRDRMTTQMPRNTQSVARMNGYFCREAVRGKYVAMCEGDDFWTQPQKLQAQTDFLETHPDYSIVFHEVDVIYDTGESWEARHPYAGFDWCNLHPERETYGLKDILEAPLIPTCSLMYRSPERWPLTEWLLFCPSGDMALAALLCDGKKVHFMPETWGSYRKHQGGITSEHTGNFIHQGRILMYLGLFLELDKVPLESLIHVIRSHHDKTTRGDPPYDFDLWNWLFSQALDKIERTPKNGLLRILAALLHQIHSGGNSSIEVVKEEAKLRLHTPAPRHGVQGNGQRVVFSIHAPNQINGPNIWLTRLAPRLRELGFEPIVLAFYTHEARCPVVSELRASGVQCFQLPWSATETAVIRIVSWIRAIQPSAFVPNLNIPSYFASRWIREAGIPTIGILHSDDTFHHEIIEEFGASGDEHYLSALVTVSRALEDRVQKAVSHQPVHLSRIPYGAPIPQASARFRRPFRLIYAGRLSESQKRISETVRILQRTTLEIDEVEAIIYGDGPARSEVERILRTEVPGHRVSYGGVVDAGRLPQIYAEAQAFVLLSDFEGLSIALMEAMASGLVPICTRVGSGHDELITHNMTGLFTRDRGDDFVVQVRRLCGDETLWTGLSHAARNHIAQSFDSDRNAREWSQLLKALIDESSSPVPLPILEADKLNLPPPRTNPKGIAREDRRIFPITPSSVSTPMTESIDPFLNPALEVNNADRYWVRHSILEAVKKHLPAFHGTFLDVGCGVMPYRSLIARNASRVSKYIGLDLQTELYVADVDLRWDGVTIPLEDNSVDCAMATEVLEHCPDPLVTLREIRRVLKPGGVFFFTVPFIWPLHDAPYDFFRYTPFTLERLLQDAQFEDIKIEALGGWNASLAQMIGLWLKRAPMAQETRQQMAQHLFPLYQQLVENDQCPSDPKKGDTMATGWSGTARTTLPS